MWSKTLFIIATSPSPKFLSAFSRQLYHLLRLLTALNVLACGRLKSCKSWFTLQLSLWLSKLRTITTNVMSCHNHSTTTHQIRTAPPHKFQFLPTTPDKVTMLTDSPSHITTTNTRQPLLPLNHHCTAPQLHSMMTYQARPHYRRTLEQDKDEVHWKSKHLNESRVACNSVWGVFYHIWPQTGLVITSYLPSWSSKLGY